ncbi:MAG: ATPase, T2SS/T4P/T4SS family, partial [Planctomycetota bacterium]|nr:ATPase, T2SS/T4P/T4SS family [Planctomycetota bacterium]
MSATDTAGGRRLLGQILKERGAVREGQVQEGLEEQRKHGGLIGQCLVELGHCSAGDVSGALAVQAGMETVDLTSGTPMDEALELVDSSTAHTYCVLPLRLEGSILTVALADPLNTAVLQDLSFTTGMEVRGAVAEEQALRAKVSEHYGEEASLADAIAAAASATSDADPESAAASLPVVRLLNSLLHRAVRDRASDVHFEVFEDSFRIRYRVDGSLFEVEAPPAHLALPLVSRIKVMSDLDITETRLPQDGRIELSIDGRPVDLRVAT